MPVTIRDIAKHLDLSHATVSRVLNGKGQGFISDATRERVLAAAKELGYRRNYHALALHTGRANAIGALCGPNFQDDGWRSFWGPVVGGIAEAAARHGLDFLLVGAEVPRKDTLFRGLGFLEERRLDALVIPGIVPLDHHRAALRACTGTVVAAHMYGEAPDHLPAVRLDPAPGMVAAVEHLASLGHRRLLWFDVPERQHDPVRREAFRGACRRLGLAWEETAVDFTPAGDREGRIRVSARAFAAVRPRFAGISAVVCFNEQVAQGVIAAALDAGMRIPRDLSVIGFDDVFATFAVPAMTVVSHMFHEIGMQAGELACTLIGGGTPPSRRIAVPSRLIVRESTGPAPIR